MWSGLLVWGVVFVVAVLVALVHVQAGIVRNPVTLGFVVTGAGVLLLLAYWLEKLGVLAGEALDIFFVIALGLFFIAYGLIVLGLLPAVASSTRHLPSRCRSDNLYHIAIL